MTDSFKGGKGNKAPYEITHIRVPLPLKEVLKKAIAVYVKARVINDDMGAREFTNDLDKFLRGFVSRYGSTYNTNKLIKIDEALEIREKLIEKTKAIAELEQERDILEAKNREVVALLEYALGLKANSGGAIKVQIKEALLHLSEKGK